MVSAAPRIEQSRKKTCNTTKAWPQCAHTKVGAGAAGGSAGNCSGDGGATSNSPRASAKLSLRLPLASSPQWRIRWNRPYDLPEAAC
jgi:hypothetical protein